MVGNLLKFHGSLDFCFFFLQCNFCCAWKLNSAALAGEKKSRGTAKACPRSPKIQPWSNDSSHLKVQLLSILVSVGDACDTWDYWIFQWNLWQSHIERLSIVDELECAGNTCHLFIDEVCLLSLLLFSNRLSTWAYVLAILLFIHPLIDWHDMI